MDVSGVRLLGWVDNPPLFGNHLRARLRSVGSDRMGSHQSLTNLTRDELLDQLNAEHRALKARLRELGRHISLTSAEKVEYAQLKKMKLRAKDRIRMLQQG